MGWLYVNSLKINSYNDSEIPIIPTINYSSDKMLLTPDMTNFRHWTLSSTDDTYGNCSDPAFTGNGFISNKL